ncbi:MAG: hypothetical protein COA49_01640 [Bacteroidetes bacterium]|nr:MAG: hypothetical protein COA49_01640 [Bacteroidota bacterium]
MRFNTNTRATFAFATLMFGLQMLAPLNAEAQFFKRNKKTEQSEDKKSNSPKHKTISEITKNAEEFDGLFTMYRDTITGESWMSISEDAFTKEFIYFSQVEDGILETGKFRGSYGASKVISFNKEYERIEILQENTRYYFNPESPLSKADNANINTPILASLKIVAKDKATDSTETKYLVSGDLIFLSEKISMIKPPSHGPRKSALGKLSKDKTKILEINNYPENLEVVVDYFFDNPNPSGRSSAFTDSRYISVSYRHALLQMPEEDGFTPRKDDARIGYFMTQVNDMTSPDLTPWNDMIHRWRLEKKDPEAALSEPVKPITWWIENTTPYEFRDYIKTGVEKWNLAFEKIGFKNAIVVKIQPDDADWDAGDIRYNVLRWTSSPSTPFSGYGPSFVNPRTGEILGADVMLEFAGMAGRLWKAGVFETDGMRLSTRERTAQMINMCNAGSVMAENTLFSLAAMQVLSFDDSDHDEFIRQTLHRLSLHEVGHTLGFSHNMHASTMLSPDELKDPEVVASNGMCNSVMEYPAINFARNPEDQTLYYDDSPGPYDYWIVEYGYSTGLDDAEAEDARLEAILSKSTSPLLQFGNDADDMRRAGSGINPDVNIYDLSNDPVAYASERCELVNDLLGDFVEKFTDSGKTYNEVRTAYLSLTGEYAVQLRVMTRQIGGVRYNRSGTKFMDGNTPFTPVSLKDQKAALAALDKYAFSPNAFDAANDCYAYLQQQRRGFGFFGKGEAPRIHSRVLSAQKGALAHLLHPVVLQRLTDSGMYGNEYDIATYMNDLTDAIFKSDLRKSVNTFRQQLQVTYVEALINALDVKKKYDRIARGVILQQLNNIDRVEKNAYSPDNLTSAHRSHIRHLIDQAWQH